MSPILTRSYDNSRTGANTKDTVLTQANIGQRGIRRITSLTMDGDARGVEAQPRILPKVKMANEKLRDVLVLCSMNNSVRAIRSEYVRGSMDSFARHADQRQRRDRYASH